MDFFTALMLAAGTVFAWVCTGEALRIAAVVFRQAALVPASDRGDHGLSTRELARARFLVLIMVSVAGVFGSLGLWFTAQVVRAL